ncbi:aspartyl protease family protein [Lichenicoccus sp.]|uniref:aspartyl protease family protein n=1 Tax=Lichenicoccus sp. TaxID=2781899 RepID=UPI003D0EF5B4
MRLAALVACLIAAPPARAESCQRVASLPLRDDGGFLSVRASIAGTPVRLMLDTGSNAGLITPNAVQVLGLRIDPGTKVAVQGTGGSAQRVAVAQAARLTLGPLVLGDIAMPIATLPAAPRLTPPVGGFLGGDVLSHFDLDIDVPRGRIALWRITPGCTPPAWLGTADSAPLVAHGDRLSLTVTLDGEKVSALLDTGARSRVVSDATARRVGVNAATLATEPGGISSGVGLAPQFYHWHRFANFTVGHAVESNPVLTVAPLDSRFDMLLGTDWLAHREVWISYAADTLFFSKPGA